MKEKIKRFFSSFKNVIIVLLTIGCIGLFFNYKSVKNKYENIIVQNEDTISFYKNKSGELYSMNKTYITDIKNLKKSNTDLYNEVKNLKDNPVVVTKIKTITEIKEIEIHDTIKIYSGNIYKSLFNYNDEWASINGFTEFNLNTLNSRTVFDSIFFNNEISFNVIEKNKQLYFLAKSDNPYVKINNINGYVLSPENSYVIRKRFDKKWCLNGGIGVSAAFDNNTVKILPGLQITFGYKILSF